MVRAIMPSKISIGYTQIDFCFAAANCPRSRVKQRLY
jgi:hypothetical protein